MSDLSFRLWTLNKNDASVKIITLSSLSKFAGAMAMMSSIGIHSSGEIPFGSTLIHANEKIKGLKICGWSVSDHIDSFGLNITDHEMKLMILEHIKTYPCDDSFWSRIKRGFKRVGYNVDAVESSIVYADSYGAWQ